MALTGEKQLMIYRDKPFVACDRNHYDNVPVRVNDLDVDLSRPAPRAKSPVIRTGDL